MLRLAVALVLCFIALIKSQESCITPEGQSGTCVDLFACPKLLAVAERIRTDPSYTEGRTYLLRSQCRRRDPSPIVACCPSEVVNPAPKGGSAQLLEPPNCGRPSLGDRILNGNDTNIDEYPWMALLYYEFKNGLIDHGCAGSLLNTRYILTAAHCLKGNKEATVESLKYVRLGEYDTLQGVDCVEDYCNKEPLDVGFDEVIVHEDYSPNNRHGHNDIALIRLDRDVSYTDFIRPVCLTLPSTRSGAVNVGDELIVAGWGRTSYPKSNNIKQHLFVPVVDHRTCAEKFRKSRFNLELRPSQLCAGGEFARDSCEGDSGGPLMRTDSKGNLFQEGVVSFGHGCGKEGWPGVYTKVTDYLGWIRNNMRA